MTVRTVARKRNTTVTIMNRTNSNGFWRDKTSTQDVVLRSIHSSSYHFLGLLIKQVGVRNAEMVLGILSGSFGHASAGAMHTTL